MHQPPAIPLNWHDYSSGNTAEYDVKFIVINSYNTYIYTYLAFSYSYIYYFFLNDVKIWTTEDQNYTNSHLLTFKCWKNLFKMAL